ncbi:shieldin complex subunit 2 [Pogona vitticeps]
MSGAPQIHIFYGAPILPAVVEKSREEKFSTTTSGMWRKLCISFTKDTSYFDTRKCRYPDHAECQMLDDAGHSKDPLTAKKCRLPDVLFTDSAADVKSIESFSNKTKERDKSASSIHLAFGSTSKENDMNCLTCDQLPSQLKISEQRGRKSEDAEGEASCTVCSHLDISPWTFLTSQADKPLDVQCDSPQLLSQYLEIQPQIMGESKPGKTCNVSSSLAISTDTEFHSILVASQVPLLSGRCVVGQNEIQSKSAKRTGMKLFEPQRNDEVAIDSYVPLKEINDLTADIKEINCRNNYESSLELFDSDSPVKENSLLEETDFHDKNGIPAGLLHLPDVKPSYALYYTEPLKKAMLYSEVHHSAKRSQAFEDTLSTFNSAAGDHQQTKKVKLTSSSVNPVLLGQGISRFQKVLKYPSLLKDCFCKSKKYTVLVTVLHPCHIKEIQIKPGTKLASKVPLATVVVSDQSEIQLKVVLWRASAFWSLTVFPGDIVLFTDVTVYENHWAGEKMLQSTSTTQLFNFGSCSTMNHNEFSHIVDVNILQDLLAYVSSKHTCLQALPQRKTQTLNNVQHVVLDQLKPDILVHLVVKIVDITVLTESTYSFKGERQRKIILTVEQVKDQHYALVLWGAVAAHYPQLQRKRDHKWEFKYLFVKHSPVSGELELHTTPWSTLECLFDDDRRAFEFREMFERSAKPLMSVTALAAHLEEKRSGMIQMKACISALKFTIDASPRGQLVFDANTSFQHIYNSLALIIFVGCAKCGLELQTDSNKIYKQCMSCLPSNKMKIFYRPSVMTVEDEGYEVRVQVVSELMEKMFLNIPAEWLNRAIEPSLDTTYGMIVADLCHSLLTDTKASYLLTVRSHFVLDENSYPLDMDFHLVDFHLDL